MLVSVNMNIRDLFTCCVVKLYCPNATFVDLYDLRVFSRDSIQNEYLSLRIAEKL